MRQEQLLYALEIAKTHSMRKASDNLYITQPAISDSINRLEYELGYPIFKRTTKGVELTQIGEQAIPLIEDILYQMENLRDLKYNRNSFENDEQIYGNITIHATQYFINSVLPNYIKMFTKKNSGISFKIIGHSYDTIIQNVLNDQCDLAFFSTTPKLLKQLSLNTNYIIQPLFKALLYVILSNNSEFSRKKYFSLNNFSEKHALYIVGYDMDESLALLNSNFEKYYIPPIRMLTDNFNLILNQIKDDPNGFSLIHTNRPEKYYNSNVFIENNVKLLPVKEKRYMEYVCVYKKEKLQNPLLDYFIHSVIQNVHA